MKPKYFPNQTVYKVPSWQDVKLAILEKRELLRPYIITGKMEVENKLFYRTNRGENIAESILFTDTYDALARLQKDVIIKGIFAAELA